MSLRDQVIDVYACIAWVAQRKCANLICVRKGVQCNLSRNLCNPCDAVLLDVYHEDRLSSETWILSDTELGHVGDGACRS